MEQCLAPGTGDEGRVRNFQVYRSAKSKFFFTKSDVAR